MHLDAARPRTFRAWADFVTRTPAQALFILGDLFEAWVGDDAAVQAGFEADAASVLREAAAHRWVGFMPGNRDFLLGQDLLRSCGVQLLDDPIGLVAFDQRLLLTHGDQLCLADVDYLRFRAQVRNPAWQALFLSKPLEERRALAAAMRDASREHQRSPETWADVDPEAARSWLSASSCNVLIHGHTHRPGSQALGSGIWRHVLADWEVDGPGPVRAQVLSLGCEGFARLDLDA